MNNNFKFIFGINMKKLFYVLLVFIVVVLLFNGCKDKIVEREVAVIETSMGTIVIDLFENVAPNHVDNFKKLTAQGFYDGLYFHRVIPGFMIQGGDPNTRDEDRSNDGVGQANQPTIAAEFSAISHRRGIVSMARKGNSVNSATSQFFIMAANSPSLDKQYSVFGKVIYGMDVVDKIVNVPRDEKDNPIEHVFMKKVYLEKRKIPSSLENER
jgi:cyclophilin family peptidyl-prolyl cis-trans isomerase